MAFKDARRGEGLAVVETLRTERVSPSFVRVTVGGDDLTAIPHRGYDQWFRLFLPREDGVTSFALPERVDLVGYLRYLAIPPGTRPYMRSYTVRELRPRVSELDIDFVVHGDEGIASRWCTRTRPGDRVALIEQGCGFDPVGEGRPYLLVADETGLPAIEGILRDLPSDASGTAFIEIPNAGDIRAIAAPGRFDVQWLVRDHGIRPGELALSAVQRRWIPSPDVHAYLVGEQALPTTLRRWLVGEHGVPKSAIQFVGYWRLGKAA